MRKRKWPFIFVWILFFFFGSFCFGQTPVEQQVNVNALVPAPPEEEVPPEGGVVQFLDLTPPQISDIKISDITWHSAIISWKTNELTIPQINYGPTTDYQKTIIGKNFLLSHSLKLENLLSETLYHFEIVAADKSGNRASSSDLTFKTLVGPDLTPPANISNFEAISGDREVKLSWKNPPDPDFQAVMIRRSTVFYPSSPEEGILVYDEKGETFIDIGLINEVTYYYSAFAYDTSGNFASGALALAIPQAPPVPPPPPPVVPPPPPPPVPPVVPPEVVPPQVEKLILENFDFWQEDKRLSLIEGVKIEAKIGKPLTISIDYEKVPEVLKTILVTIEKPVEIPAAAALGEAAKKKYFSFLLRINPEKTKYLATFFPPEKPGICPFYITVLDYKNQALKKISGQLEVKIEFISVKWFEQPRPKIWWLEILSTPITILVLLVICYFIFKKRKRSKIEKKNPETIDKSAKL